MLYLEFVGFILFIRGILADVGILSVPLFICISAVIVVLIERILFFLFVFKREDAVANIKDVIHNNRRYPKQLREDLVNIELDEIHKNLESGFGLLKFVASIATMLGLLGTIIGMIDVFSSISTIKTAVSPTLISSGIKKAMYTTAYGLTISIIAITIHYILFGISSKIFLKLEEYSNILNVTQEYERFAEIEKSRR